MAARSNDKDLKQPKIGLMGHLDVKLKQIVMYATKSMYKFCEITEIRADGSTAKPCMVDFKNILPYLQLEGGWMYLIHYSVAVKQSDSTRLAPVHGQPLQKRRSEV